jgi:uncharacterized protein YdeI (YjbR/CyaY-like superfamily)
MMDVPPTASEHPTTWKFDFPVYHPVDLGAWRAWLAVHHATARGCWVASWRKASGRAAVPYPDLVEEALCWGWIDSTANTLDDDRGLQMMTPRKPKSTWTRLNRRRVAEMEAQGRMTDAGRRIIEIAQANGWWTILDPVEDLIVPDDLAAALDADPDARAAWERTSPSMRKQFLFQIVSAAGADTRARRITKIVADLSRQPP